LSCFGAAPDYPLLEDFLGAVQAAWRMRTLQTTPSSLRAECEARHGDSRRAIDVAGLFYGRLNMMS
jgi:hypothetical protein